MPEPAPQPEPLPTSSLQFQTAESASTATGQRCVACKQVFDGPYYHVQGQTVCPACAERIQNGQQAPGAFSLARAALYGAGGAFAGFLIYSIVSLVTGYEIGLIAILVGWMVGKAVRKGSNGLGGRPQQILAVALTYFSITTSYIPLFVQEAIKQERAQGDKKDAAAPAAEDKAQMSFGAAVGAMLLLAAVAPFLSLTQGLSSLITLFIIFIGLKQAWRLTGRTDFLVMGPYDPAAPSQ